MDNVILDVVLGLLLIYLVLALLTTKVQEMYFGQMRSGRTRTMHKMLLEAVGHDSGLKDRILANPTIFALFEGDQKAGKPSLMSAKGPSAIPPDLFARALLVELYDDPQQSHPSKVYTPEAFIRNKAPAKPAGTGQPGSVWSTLRALLPGHEADWPGFEAAVSHWYKAVGERADGWYQRYAQNRSFWVALGLALLLNADTFVISDRLANDPELRRSLSTIAQNVNSLFQQEQAQQRGETDTATAPPAAAPPDARAERALGLAANQIIAAYFNHEEVAKFDANFAKLSGDKQTALIIQCAAATTDTELIRDTNRQPARNVFLSNPINWLYVVTTLGAEIDILRRPPKSNPEEDRRRNDIHLEDSYDCLARLHGLVSMVANRQATDSNARTNLNEAVVQLKLALTAMREWLQDSSMPLSFTRLFQTDPEAFIRCAQDPSVARENLRQCVQAAQTGRVILPLGWGEANRRLSLCKVEVENLPALATRSATAPVVQAKPSLPPSSTSDGLCGEFRRFDGNAALRLPRMQLVGPDAWRWVGLLFGLLCTALFVALGAPFWFDVLGRVVKLRAAGSKAKEDALATPDDGGASKNSGSRGASDDGGPQPFANERNELERVMSVPDVLALQAVLQVPRTGKIDKATRNGIEVISPKLGLPVTDEVTLVLFQQLAGRMPEGLGSLDSPSASMKLGVDDVRSPDAAQELMRLMSFPNRIAPPPPQKVTDDMRALAVLWRYKREVAAGKALPNLDLVTEAKTRNKLDEISAADVSLLLDSKTPPVPAFARESARWMDWALGELGQAEAQAPPAQTRSASNQRILEYFAACKDLVSTESTPWCAAFASWVLQRHDVYDQGQPPVPRSTSSKFYGGPGSTFGTPIWKRNDPWPPGPAAALTAVGDVVTLAQEAPGNVDHVGFLVASDNGHVWLLSGNFSNRVGVDKFPIAQVEEIRRP